MKKIRCGPCNKDVKNWENHIRTKTHIKNVEKQRKENESMYEKNCPLCNIPKREPVLFENELVYLVQTKTLKGHKVRVMAVIKRHAREPSFEERSFAYACINDYMTKHTKKFFLAAPKNASIPDHWHLIACDEVFSDKDEKWRLFTDPHIELPLIAKKVLIGIPAYNEENKLQTVINKAKEYGSVLVVDDGSTDNTGKIIQKSCVNVITHNTNLGYGASIKDIFNYANKQQYDSLVILDADGQHKAEEIPEFLKTLDTSDIVVGNRFMSDNKIPKYRRLGIKTISKFSKIEDAQCGFRAYNKKAIQLIANKLYDDDMGASVEILVIAQTQNLKIKEIPCSVKYDEHSHSQNPLSHGLKVLTSLFWTLIWENPTKTLLLPGLIALTLAIISGLQTINLYLQFKMIVISWALFTIGATVCGFLILNVFTFIFVFKNKRMK